MLPKSFTGFIGAALADVLAFTDLAVLAPVEVFPVIVFRGAALADVLDVLAADLAAFAAVVTGAEFDKSVTVVVDRSFLSDSFAVFVGV